MAQLGWVVGVIVVLVALGLAWRRLGRAAGTRAAVIEEVRRTLRDGALERGDRGTRVRGRLGALDVTVDLQTDPRRPRQSPMWRVTAEGPVGLEYPIEARVAGWEGWIDPWMQLGEMLSVPGTNGIPLTLHADRPPADDHPLIAALQRQRERLGPGAIHVRHGLIRVETRCSGQLEENRPLFAFLHVVGEMAELPPVRPRAGSPSPRYGMLSEGS